MKDKYCLQSIESFQSINQSPNNKSSTKQTFSFSRSSRFQTIKPTCLLFYSDAQPIPMEVVRSVAKDQELASVMEKSMISQNPLSTSHKLESIQFQAFLTQIDKQREEHRLAPAERYLFHDSEYQIQLLHRPPQD